MSDLAIWEVPCKKCGKPVTWRSWGGGDGYRHRGNVEASWECR